MPWGKGGSIPNSTLASAGNLYKVAMVALYCSLYNFFVCARLDEH
jgi:hypothetical protein